MTDSSKCFDKCVHSVNWIHLNNESPSTPTIMHLCYVGKLLGTQEGTSKNILATERPPARRSNRSISAEKLMNPKLICRSDGCIPLESSDGKTLETPLFSK